MGYRKMAMSKQFNYGGQAVLEGVMMRGSKHMAVAVRAPYGFCAEALKVSKAQYPSLTFPESAVDATSAALKSDRADFAEAVKQEGKIFAIKVNDGGSLADSEVKAMTAAILRIGAHGSDAFAINAGGEFESYGD